MAEVAAGKVTRRGAVVLTGFTLLLCGFAVSAQAVPGEAQILALGLVVGPGGTGTAFHVGRGCWVSAAHVVTAPVVRLVTHDGVAQGAVASRVHPSRDVAVLLGPRVRHALQIAARWPAPGEPVWAVGFPGESRRYGQVVAVRGRVHVNSGDGGLVWVEGVVFAGHSGSPVLDGGGMVVGVVVGAHRLWLDVALAEPGSAVVQLVRRGCG